MEQLERNLRNRMVLILKIIVIVGITIDISFCIMFYLLDSMMVSVEVYILKYVVLPITVNIITYIIANKFNKSEKYSDEHKNLVCSMALCTLAGSMSVFHSCYPPLWVAPSVTLIFCSVFHSKKIHRWMLIYSCILVAVSCFYICTEGTLTVSYFVEQCIVAEAITIICGLVSSAISTYQLNVLGIIKESMKKELEYRNRLEYDILTGVHSRVYMNEIARDTFGKKDGKKHVGIAILDLDNFKKVNDSYGHDNGDKVLQVLGSLLNEHASENEEVGRFGGEEFIVIFKEGNPDKYIDFIENVRKKMVDYTFDFMEEKISFSSGLVKCTSNVLYDDAFKMADNALYVSKETGKNKVTIREMT